VAWVAGTFWVLVGLAMLVSYQADLRDDPLRSPQLKEYKAKLRVNPADEQLKQRIREFDLQLRQSHLRQRSLMNSGSWLLLGGVAVFIVAVTQAARFQKRPPMPQPRAEISDQAARIAAKARWSVAAMGVAIGGFLFVLGLGFSTALPKRSAEIGKLLGTGEATGTGDPRSAGPALVPDAASALEMKQNWPWFRGWEGGGVTMFSNTPAKWDTQTGAGLAWKTPVPAKGFNSPIVWGERVFLSGGDAKQREVFCLDLKTGQLLWRQAEPTQSLAGPAAVAVPDSSGYAAATMATDGRRVYVVFGDGLVAGLTLEGKVLWTKSFGPLKNMYGHASSLATWQDRVILQLDQGESEESKSKLYALDGRTGQVVWQRPRKVGSSWATPIVIEAAGKAQVITLAVPNVIAYAASNGTELWRVDCLNGEVTPSPIFAGGSILVASPSEKLVAIRPDGQGDVTRTHVAWTAEDNVPDVTSPVGNGELVFALTTPGMLSCFDAKDGKKQWDHDFEFECHASPSIAGGRLYVFGQKGTAVIVAVARQFQELFRTQMDDAFHASPAFAQDRIVLRGVTNVWCVGPTVERAAK
jgi:outer membrane protein assembly factor BamB